MAVKACNLVSGDPVKCPAHMFKCGSEECLDFGLVCDGVANCQDQSDEGPGCLRNVCSNQQQCEHCFNTPYGAVGHSNYPTCLLSTNVLYFSNKPRLFSYFGYKIMASAGTFLAAISLTFKKRV